MAQGQIEKWEKKDNPDITVQAALLNEDNVLKIAAWCGGNIVEEIDPEHRDETQPGLNLMGTNGMVRASLGQYVVEYGGTFFVTHIRRFEEVYQPAMRESPPPESPGDSRRRRGLADPFDSARFGP